MTNYRVPYFIHHMDVVIKAMISDLHIRHLLHQPNTLHHTPESHCHFDDRVYLCHTYTLQDFRRLPDEKMLLLQQYQAQEDTDRLNKIQKNICFTYFKTGNVI